MPGHKESFDNFVSGRHERARLSLIQSRIKITILKNENTSFKSLASYFTSENKAVGVGF